MPDTDIVKQACDECRRRKVRCNNDRPCHQCKSASLRCHTSLKQRKKGRQGKTANVLNELRAKGTQSDDVISQSVQNAQYELHMTDGAPSLSGESGRCQFARSAGLVSHELIASCSDYFFSRMRGTVPILHSDGFQRQIDQAAECLHAYCLVTAFCAFVVTQTGYCIGPQILNNRGNVTQEKYREELVEEATEARKHLDPFKEPMKGTIITAFLLYGCHIGLGNQRHAYYFLREATTIYTASALEGETSAEDDGEESSQAGNLFWLLLVSERYYLHLAPNPKPFLQANKAPEPMLSGDIDLSPFEFPPRPRS